MSLRAVILGLSAVVAALCCGPPCAAAGDPVYGGELVIKLSSDAAVDDPVLARTRDQRLIAGLQYPRLIEMSISGGRVAGVLVKWDESADGLVYRFTVRDDSDHSAVPVITSGDLAVSLQHLLKAAPRSAAGRLLQSIEGAGRFLDGQAPWLPGLTVPDDRTLVIRLARRQPLFMDAMSDIRAAPVRGVADSGDEVRARLGPFAPEGSGAYAANLSFFSGRPFLDRILIRVGEGAARRSAAVSIDPRKTAEAGGAGIEYPGAQCIYIAFHPGGALKTKASRAAVLSVIDAEAMARIFFAGSGTVLQSLAPSRAVPEELLGPSPLPSAEGPPGVSTLRLGLPVGSAELQLIAERIKVDLLVSGVEVKLAPYDERTLPQCDLFLVEMLISDYAPEYTLWSGLVALTNLTGDEQWTVSPHDDALAWLREVNERLGANLTLAPLLQLRYSMAVDDRLRGVRFRFDGTLDLENAWIQPPGDSP